MKIANNNKSQRVTQNVPSTLKAVHIDLNVPPTLKTVQIDLQGTTLNNHSQNPNPTEKRRKLFFQTYFHAYRIWLVFLVLVFLLYVLDNFNSAVWFQIYLHELYRWVFMHNFCLWNYGNSRRQNQSRLQTLHNKLCEIKQMLELVIKW